MDFSNLNKKMIPGLVIILITIASLGLISYQFLTINSNNSHHKDFEKVFFSITDSQHNLILYGQTSSIDFPFTKNISDISSDQPVIFLMKYSETGKLLWSIRYVVTVNNGLTSLKVDKNNNILITGLYQDQETLNFFVTKFSPNGDLLFRTNITNADSYKQLDILVSENNNVFLFGKLSKGFNYVNEISTEYYSEQQFLSKLDPNGTILWNHSYKPANVEHVLIDANNNFFYSEYVTQVDKYSVTHYYLYLNKINSNGTFLWHKFVNEVGIGRYSNMAIDSKNNIIITGLTVAKNFTLMNTTKLTNITDDGLVYMTKLSNDGAKLWDKIQVMCYPAGSIPSLSVNANDEIFIKGSFNTTKYLIAPTIYSVNYASNGSIMTVNGTAEPIAISPYEIIFNNIVMNQDGSYYTIGVTSTPSNLLEGRTIKGSSDVLVLKFNSTNSFEWGTYIGGL